VPHPQPGIFALGTRSHHFLEFDLREGSSADALMAKVSTLREPHTTTAGANLVLGFSPDLWREVGPVPDGVHPFRTIQGAAGYEMPATQHDLWLWAAASSTDVAFDVARASAAALAPVASVATEVVGFAYRDSRDLSGFIDGTENPDLFDAAEVALVGTGPGHGGSVVLVQKWIHNLGALHDRPLEAQEAVFGRTKADSVELDDKDPGAHLSRVVIEEDGEELQLFRRSTPFGTLSEQGLLFIAFTAEQRRIDRMLARMAGDEDGVLDLISTFSTPVAGSFYWVPPVEDLPT